MDSVNWIYLRVVIQIDRWHVFKDTHEGVYVSEDLKTTSCKDCNLSPKGSVKTKACSSTRLLIWVHIWEAGSQALTTPPRWALCAWMCCHWTVWRGSAQTKSGCDIKFKISISFSVSLMEPLIWALKNWCHPVDTASVNMTSLFISF